MTPLRIAALALIVIGALILAYPAMSFTTREKVLEVGPIEVTRQEEHTVPYAPIIGGVAIALGVGLLLTGRKRA
jgi:hypothetical protein